MKAKFMELFAHLQPGYTQPARRPGLISASEAYGLRKQFWLEVRNHTGKDIGNFTTLRPGQ